jgi:hypothetical protein
MNKITSFLLPIAIALGVVVAGAGAYHFGYASGYDQIAYADPVPRADLGPAGLALFDAGTDAAVSADVAASSPPAAPPPEVKTATPDPVEHPSKAWAFLVAMWKLGIWPAVAAALLLISRAVIVRLKPKDGDGSGWTTMYSGWRGKVLAIAAAVVAVSGPTLEVLLGTGGVAAIAVGVIYAFGLLKDAFDPPRGSQRPLSKDVTPDHLASALDKLNGREGGVPGNGSALTALEREALRLHELGVQTVPRGLPGEPWQARSPAGI